MKTRRALYLVDDEHNYVIDDNEHYTVKLTKDVREATDYRFKIFRWASRKAAEEKYGRKFTFKKYIPMTGSFDIQSEMRIGQEISNHLGIYGEVILLALGVIGFFGLVKEQGFFTAVVLYVILVKVLTLNSADTNSENT